MLLPRTGPDQVLDLVASSAQQLGDQPAVATPPERLGAHEARRRAGERVGERPLPGLRPHPRRVAAECGHTDAGEELLTRLAASTASELDGVHVLDPRVVKQSGEWVPIELRVPPRAREAADVDERLHFRLREPGDQLVDRPRPVSNGVNTHAHRVGLQSRVGARGPRGGMAATVSWEGLRELAAFRAEKGCAVSLYVDLDPHVSPTAGDAHTRVNSLLERATKTLDGSRTDLAHDQRWRPLPLTESVPDEIKVNDEFYLTPLVPLVGRGEGAIVVAVGRERGDLYSLHGGKLGPIADRFEEQPGRHDQGGWSQARYQRHIENLAQQHLRDVADLVDREVRRRRPAKVVIACAEDIRAEFAELLSSDARNAVVGWVHPEAHAGPPELLALALPLLERRRAEQEAQAVERWREEAGRNGRAASGWEATLEAASDGRVELLLYQVGVEHPAWRCPACGRLALEGGKCPLDGTELERRVEGLDLAVHQTLATGGTVCAVSGRHDLEPVGGIGALLRY